MAEFSVIRTARRKHHCDTRAHGCSVVIQPGERYVYASLTPGGEWGTDKWWHAATCASCEIAYGRKHAAELGGAAP